jgi:hypothetical protein
MRMYLVCLVLVGRALVAGAVWAADAGLGSGDGGRDAAPLPATAAVELTGQLRDETFSWEMNANFIRSPWRRRWPPF